MLLANCSNRLRHNADCLFYFVLEGDVVLDPGRDDATALGPGDAFVMPAGKPYVIDRFAKSLQLLTLSMPGNAQPRTV